VVERRILFSRGLVVCWNRIDRLNEGWRFEGAIEVMREAV